MNYKLLKITSNTSFLCLLLSILPFSLFAQKNYQSNYIVNVQQFGIEDGLLHQNVRAVTEDTNGFIWIATPKGVARYDGYNFKWFTKKNRTGKITNIFEIEQDKDGWLWLVNLELGEIIFLHPETEEIQTIEERFGDNFPYRLAAYSTVVTQANSKEKLISGTIYKDTEGNLVLFEEQGFSRKIFVYKGNRQFEEIALPYRKQDRHPVFLDDGAGFYWLSDIYTIYQIDKKTKELQSFPSFYKQLVPSWEGEQYCYGFLRKGEKRKIEHGKDTLIEQSYSALYKIGTNKKVEQVVELREDYRPYLFHQGQLWCLTKQGWKIVDTKGNVLFELNRQDYKASLFEALNPIPQGYFVDSKENIWFTGQFGLSVVEVKKNRFTQYFTKENPEKLPFNNSGRGIWANKETLIANFEFGGLVQFKNKKQEEFKVITSNSFFWDVSKSKNQYHGRPIIRDPQHNFWIGNQTYLQKWSADFSSQKKYHFLPSEHEPNIFALYQDGQQNIWIGTLLGLHLLAPNKDSIQTIIQNDSTLNSELYITNIIPASETTLWLCARTGLYLFDTQLQKIITSYNLAGKGANYLPANKIHHIYIDQAADKWIASAEGLIYWNHKTNEKRLFSQEEGLSNDEIIAVYEDEHQHLWLASRFGIMQFDKTNFRVVNTFLPKDGTTYHRTNRISHFQEKDGTIYFGGYNGITAFHPDDFYGKEAEQTSKVMLTNFTQFDGQKNQLVDLTSELFQSKVITMQPDDRFFRLTFALLNFEDKEQNYYAWKIDGVDKDWNYQSENVIRLSRQPYGNHTLRIKGQGSDGVWSPHELTLQLKVLKPFYLRTWFLLLSFGTFLMAVFGWYYWRTNRFEIQQNILKKEVKKATQQIETDKLVIENQAKELRQLDKLKSNFFANVSHELRTPLTLMLGPISSVIKRDNLSNQDFTLLKRAQQSGKDLLKLVTSILDLSKMEAGKMGLKEETIVLFTFTRRIVAAFESYAQNKEVDFTFDFQAEKNLQLAIDKEKLAVILNNLLSNAVKFTPKNGKIKVTVADLGNALQITVADTGRGIHPNDLPHVFNRFYQSNQPDAPTEGGTGIGLSLSQEFAKIMNGALWVESEVGNGSTFFVKIPRKEILGMVLEEKVLQKEQEIIIPSAAAIAREEANKTKANLLIVEDNYSLRDYLITILSPYYVIQAAEDGEEAYELLSKFSKSADNTGLPDLIISDIMMPKMDGFQLLKAIKENDQLSRIPIIMLTARADMQDKLKALRIGVDDYLLKPFEEEELLARIDNLLLNANQRLHFTKAIEEPEEKRVIAHSKEDSSWLMEVETLVAESLSDATFSVGEMAKAFFISERTLLRRLKKLTGLTPNQYLQEVRFNEARKILEQKTFNNLTKVANAVGFSDVNSFSKRYKKRFGKLPSDY